MFQGTENYPDGEFSRIIAENGGNENAFTGKDYTEAEEKSPDDGNDAPSDEQQTEFECEGDIVDLYASTEEL